MQNFLEVKNKVGKFFSGREGFSDEIIDAITATYIYLDEKYPEIISEKEIPDCGNFSLRSKQANGRTLANIYINRIYNNVKKVETVKEGAPNEYISKDKKVVLCEKDINNRISSWSHLDNNQKQELSKKLRAKIITHELIHAGSDNGESVGFMVVTEDSYGLSKVIEKYHNSKQMRPDMSRLEEMMTEILALDIVGCKNIPELKTAHKLSFKCRNLDSSNGPINCIAEYFVRAYPDTIKGKFVNPLGYLGKFVDDYKDFGLDKKDNMLYELNNYLRDLSKFAQHTDKDSYPAIRQRYEFFQGSLLDIYNKNLKFNNKQDVVNAIKDYAVFKNFAYKVDGKIENPLQEKLNELRERCNNVSKLYGICCEQVYKNAIGELHGKDENGNVINQEPYGDIKFNNNNISTQN